jgi:hypothetical protein
MPGGASRIAQSRMMRLEILPAPACPWWMMARFAVVTSREWRTDDRRKHPSSLLPKTRLPVDRVTLDNLAEMVRMGHDLAVYDAKTGENITRGVLTQIIVEL